LIGIGDGGGPGQYRARVPTSEAHMLRSKFSQSARFHDIHYDHEKSIHIIHMIEPFWIVVVDNLIVCVVRVIAPGQSFTVSIFFSFCFFNKKFVFIILLLYSIQDLVNIAS
jgi:hypothetical protein